ncbi:hypothetical protein K7432_014593 [Basidiobolus ranarum]|uniref:Uncharacterized protein n=1 Tax=Basidiobolus ranarum TaxID=34480 RepID=A0ABR2WHE1_9FUNG
MMFDNTSNSLQIQTLLHPARFPAYMFIGLCFPLISFLFVTFITFAVATTVFAAVVLSLRFGLLTMNMSWTVVVGQSIQLIKGAIESLLRISNTTHLWNYSEPKVQDTSFKKPIIRGLETKAMVRRRRRSNSQ